MKYDEIWTLLEAPQWTNLFHITEDKCCIVLAAGGSCVTQDIKTRAGLQLPTHQQSIGSNVDGYILNPQHFGLCWFIPPKLTATYQMLTTLPVGTCLSNPLHRVSYSQKKETKTSGHFFPSWLHIIPHIVNERSSNLSPPVLDGKNQGTISLEKKIKKDMSTPVAHPLPTWEVPENRACQQEGPMEQHCPELWQALWPHWLIGGFNWSNIYWSIWIIANRGAN